jgi:ABC-2 type transport system permease protein
MSAPVVRHGIDAGRLASLVRKESLQVVRDPSAILIAFALPVVLLFLFAYAVSLDVRAVRIGLVLEDDSVPGRELAAAFGATRYFEVTPARTRAEVEAGIIAGRLRGMVVIPADFPQRLHDPERGPLLQIIADGSQPNTANFVAGYARGVLRTWLAGQPSGPVEPIAIEPRFWFNPELESRQYLVPGAIAIVMAMIGTMLTALVIAREWERGTMEAVMSTPAGIVEILLGKLLPYFALGLVATLGCAGLATLVFGVPLRGSWIALIALSAAFLVPALGQGLLISAVTRNQFVAAQVALLSGFLPALLLSGFLFEIDSMPAWIRALTYVLPARYFVASLHTVFLAGNVWAEFGKDMLSMLVIGLAFFAITARNTRKSLDT